MVAVNRRSPTRPRRESTDSPGIAAAFRRAPLPQGRITSSSIDSAAAATCNAQIHNVPISAMSTGPDPLVDLPKLFHETSRIFERWMDALRKIGTSPAARG